MNLVKQWRKESSHTFEEMAARCGSSTSHLTNIVAGRVGMSSELIRRVELVRNKEFLIREGVKDKLIIEYEIELMKKSFKSLKDVPKIDKKIKFSTHAEILGIPGHCFDPTVKKIEKFIKDLDLNIILTDKIEASNEKCEDCGGSGADETGRDFCRTCRGKGIEEKIKPLKNEVKRLKAMVKKINEENTDLRIIKVQNENLKKTVREYQEKVRDITLERNERIQELSKIDPSKLSRHNENELMISTALPIIDGVWTSAGAKAAQRFKKRFKERFKENGL